jgi:hypothetical protein
MQTFKFGQRARFSVTFTDLIAGAVSDPTTVALKLRDPSGTETVYTLAGAQVIRASAGMYYFDVTLGVRGEWLARWVGSGSLVAVDELKFRVEASGFTSP